MNPRSPLSRHQRALMQGVRSLGCCTDESLVAHLDSVGERIDRTTLVRWRKGERTAPLGLLPVMLGHVDDPASVLDLLARPLGLRVVPDCDPDSDGRSLTDRAMQLVELAGEVAKAVRGPRADDQLERAAAALRRCAAEIEAMAQRGAA